MAKLKVSSKVLLIKPSAPPNPHMYYVYILRSELHNRYYIGSTKDAAIRLAQHNAGKSISTRKNRPWKIIYTEPFETLNKARQREQQIKSWKNPGYMEKTLTINS
jgi:putative endonuclease